MSIDPLYAKALLAAHRIEMKLFRNQARQPRFRRFQRRPKRQRKPPARALAEAYRRHLAALRQARLRRSGARSAGRPAAGMAATAGDATMVKSSPSR